MFQILEHLLYSSFCISVRENLKDLTKQYDKSENDLKALQSVGQVGIFLFSAISQRRLLRLVCLSVDALSWYFVSATPPIFLKLCRSFVHGVKMCMWFGHFHQIIYFYLFLHVK